jgi:hypothetical protein
VSNVCTVKASFPLFWILQDYCHPPRLIPHRLIVFLYR